MRNDSPIIDQCLAHQDYIYNFVYKLTNDGMLSEEILQETYIKAVANIDQFEGRSDLKTWLIAIAKNEVFKRINQQRKDKKRLEEIRKRENEKAHSHEVNHYEYSIYIDQIRDGCLYALIMCLPFNQRCAFILYVLNEVPINVAAEILGKTENATRILVSRAKSTIREFLCNNCEHLDREEKCKCINMANFSLQNHLIRTIDATPHMATARMELRKFNDEIELLKALPSKELSNLIEDANFRIIFSKK
jgi:RNA polymerase sigma factor (sigma-70 family)